MSQKKLTFRFHCRMMYRGFPYMTYKDFLANIVTPFWYDTFRGVEFDRIYEDGNSGNTLTYYYLAHIIVRSSFALHSASMPLNSGSCYGKNYYCSNSI